MIALPALILLNTEEMPMWFPFAVIALFPVVLFLISWFGGWWALAKTHPFEAGETGMFHERFRFCSVKTSFFGSYNNCVVISIYENGISMRPFFPFSLFHQPVFIRWTDIQQVNYKNRFGLSADVIGADFSLRFYRISAARIQQHFEQFQAGAGVLKRK
jgi:hypothetical protein